MDLTFHPKAAEDARLAARKYAEISEGLSQRFWEEIDRTIEGIGKFPERHHFDPSGFRRANLLKFPYHILFEQDSDSIRVMVVRHNRRHPSFGTSRR